MPAGVENSIEDRPTAAGIIVAHPDDETMWAGGAILMHPTWPWDIYALCRGSDPDRAPRFHRALQRLRASGRIADLNDGPDQTPLPDPLVEQQILSLVGDSSFDILMTHGPNGEYTTHRRHIETSNAVTALWRSGRVEASELWFFAYEDGGGAHLPRAIENADTKIELPPQVWEEKYGIIHEVYGFDDDTWEARATPKIEAFWRFTSADQLAEWMRGASSR